MFRQRLKSFFEKTPAIHYIKQHETVVIGEIVVDVKNIILWFWPLALVPLYTGQFLLTVHTEETRHFTEESENYAKKRCLTEPIAGAPYMYQSFRKELVHVFGQEWFDALVACATRYHQRPAQ